MQLRWTYPPLDIDNSNGQFPLLAPNIHQPYVSACRFDRLGSLLACSSSSGRLAILDMDIALAQPLRQPCRPIVAETVRSYDMPKSVYSCVQSLCVSLFGCCVCCCLHSHCILLAVRRVIVVSFRIDCLQWEPTSDDCIVVSSGQHADILRFDLNHTTTQPTTRSTLPNTAQRRLSTTASAITDFTFIPSHPHTLLAVTGEGALQWWDLRAGRVRNPVLAHSTARVPCGVSALSALPLVYVWRVDASVDVYDVRRLPAERRREVRAWRLAEGGLNKVKAVEPHGDEEARFILETDGGSVSVFDVWQGKCTTVAGKQLWTGDMAVHGGRKRRVAWMRGLGGGGGSKVERGCSRVIAHATGGTDVKFSRVPLHSRGHFSSVIPPAADQPAEMDEDECFLIDDDLLDTDLIEWSDDNDADNSDPQHIQPSIHAFFEPLSTQNAPQLNPPPQPITSKTHTQTHIDTCACCPHAVGRVGVGGSVCVMESHPTLDVLVCGLNDNRVVVVGASCVADEDEELD